MTQNTNTTNTTTGCGACADYYATPSCGGIVVPKDFIYLYCAAAERGHVVLVEKATSKTTSDRYNSNNNNNNNDDMYDNDDDGPFLSDLLWQENYSRQRQSLY